MHTVRYSIRRHMLTSEIRVVCVFLCCIYRQRRQEQVLQHKHSKNWWWLADRRCSNRRAGCFKADERGCYRALVLSSPSCLPPSTPIRQALGAKKNK